MAFWAQLRAAILGAALLAAGAFYLHQTHRPKIGVLAGRPIAGATLRTAFERQCRAVVILPGIPVDAMYFAPSAAEVGRLIELAKNHAPYQPEVYDCDDFSRHFKDTLQQLWMAEGNQYPLAVFEIYAALLLPDDTIGYHAFNFIMTDQGRLIYIEPQGPWALTLRRTVILQVYRADI